MIEDKHACPHCGREINPHPYLMSVRRERPILPVGWAVVLLATLVTTLIAVAVAAA